MDDIPGVTVGEGSSELGTGDKRFVWVRALSPDIKAAANVAGFGVGIYYILGRNLLDEDI